jgi:4-amino-4-deoxy-L-arabinose transferase-like glycosyltransferase
VDLRSARINIGFLLVFVFALGSFLRLYHLSTNPVGFFCDEASIGLDAYSVLHTGKDSHGAILPLFFESFGDYKGFVPVYSVAPFVALFGLSEFAVRLTSVFYGLGLIWVLYLLGKALKNRTLGVLAAFIGATMPWLIHYNRTGFVDFSSYAFFFVLTIYLFYDASLHPGMVYPAFLSAGITLYTYQPARLLIPLLLVLVFMIYPFWRRAVSPVLVTSAARRTTRRGLIAFGVLCIPMLWALSTGIGLRRFTQVSVFGGHLSPVKTLLKVVSNYFVQFSPQYFLAGEGTPIMRHFTEGLLPVLVVTLPFLLVGIGRTLATWKRKESQLLLGWLLLYPIAGAVTFEPPFTARAIIGAPLFAILIAMGIVKVVEVCKRFCRPALSLAIIITAIGVNLASFSQYYFVQYPLKSGGFYGWQYGARDIVTYFKQVEIQYDDLVMQQDFNGPNIFIPFYAPGDCKNCTIGTPDDHYKPDHKQLFSVTPEYLTKHPEYRMTVLKTIRYLNGDTAFSIGTVVPVAVQE